jgi:HPt (histidine-containing phosphotransfer) domain-containing protein
MSEPTIDRSVFDELKQTAGPEFVQELVDTFLADAPLLLDNLRNAMATGDADGFRRAAHTLKSNSNTFGARALGAMARELELSGLDAALTAKVDPVEALALEYSQVAAALAALRHA